MILRRLRMKGLSVAFPEEIEIDLSAIGEGLIALAGGNGQGKTTMLECSGPATLHRTFPSYEESFADHVAPGVRHAFSELTFDLEGQTYRALVQCDPQFGAGRGKTEAFLLRLSGPDEWTPIAGPLVKDYDAAVRGILPPLDLFLASVFACQGGEGSFFRMVKGDRKALFSQMLGLAHLQEKAEGSREHAQRIVATLEAVRDSLASALEQERRATALDASITDATKTVDAEKAAGESATARVREAEAAAQAARDALTRATAAVAAAEQERSRLIQARDAATARVGSLRARQAELETQVEDADRVRAAAAELATVDAALATAQQAERDAAEKLRPVAARVAELEAKRQGLLADHARTSADLERAKAAAASAERTRPVAGEATTRRADLQAAEARIAELDAARPKLEAAAEKERADAEKRRQLSARRADHAPRRVLLAQIPGVEACSACPLTEDARAARTTVEQIDADLAAMGPAPDGFPAATALREHDAVRSKKDRERSEHQCWLDGVAGPLARLEAEEKEAARVPGLEAEIARLVREGSAVRTELDSAKASEIDLAGAFASAGARQDELRQRKAALAELAGRAAAIAAAEAQLAETRTAFTEAETAFAQARDALEDLFVPDTDQETAARDVAEESLRTAASALADAQQKLGTAEQEAARLRGERAALGDPAAEVARLQDRELELARESSDWTLLARALGRDGVQALAIDAAGPSVTSIANDLLASCFGPRFQISLETTAAKKDGGVKEVFDVRILDGEAGREAKKCSGGETVLIDEALRLALAIFNALRSGCELRTLWRDETAGALSPENADRYVAMLRRAAKIGGFRQVFFIAHSPDVVAQADARIVVSGGVATIDSDSATAEAA